MLDIQFNKFLFEYLLLQYTYLQIGSELDVEQYESGELGYRWWRFVLDERYFQLRHKSPNPLKECCNESKDKVLPLSLFQQLK